MATKASGDGGELRSTPTKGTAIISGASFVNRSVVYSKVDGLAMFEGDICLGTVEKVRADKELVHGVVASSPAGTAPAVVVVGASLRWPKCRVPYQIDPDLPNKKRVTEAIAHWESKTPIRFPAKTRAHANWVRFTDAGGCWSNVGMQGGEQTISLGSGCTTGNAIHEIGHTVGLWHEQSRQDRDVFVTIKFANIQSGMAHNFNQHIADGDDAGVYDYGSIMHYPRNAFAKSPRLATIVPVDPNARIGQRTGLSPGDIAGVRAIYPSCGVVGPRFKKVQDQQDEYQRIAEAVRGRR